MRKTKGKEAHANDQERQAKPASNSKITLETESTDNQAKHNDVITMPQTDKFIQSLATNQVFPEQICSITEPSTSGLAREAGNLLT